MFGHRKLDKLVAQHLDRRGVPSGYWLRSALDAIHACESGDSVAPIFSGGGPLPARTAVVLLELESFVDGAIDWTTPLLDGSEPSRWFFAPPWNEISLDGQPRSVLDEMTPYFFPRGDEEGVRWVDSRLIP